MLLAMIVGVVALIGGLINMMMIKDPGWMMIELLLYLVVAWLAGRMEQKRREAAVLPEAAARRRG